MGGGGSTTNNSSTPTPSTTEQAPTNNAIISTEMQPQQYVAAPENNEHTTFTTQSIQEKPKNLLVERIKNLFASPKAMWKSIDKDNSLQIGYLLKLAVIPGLRCFWDFSLKAFIMQLQYLMEVDIFLAICCFMVFYRQLLHIL